jgi:hypothetical protein
LRSVYPEHNEVWKDWERKVIPTNWKDIKNQRKFFDQLALELGIQNPEDWNFVHSKDIAKAGGSFVYRYYGSLMQGTSI